jgi:hypothetical protein
MKPAPPTLQVPGFGSGLSRARRVPGQKNTTKAVMSIPKDKFSFLIDSMNNFALS